MECLSGKNRNYARTGPKWNLQSHWCIQYIHKDFEEDVLREKKVEREGIIGERKLENLYPWLIVRPLDAAFYKNAPLQGPLLYYIKRATAVGATKFATWAHGQWEMRPLKNLLLWKNFIIYLSKIIHQKQNFFSSNKFICFHLVIFQQ